MPRYFFDIICENGFIRDTEGLELAMDPAAMKALLKDNSRITRTLREDWNLKSGEQLRVRDEIDETVCVIRLG